MFKDAQPIAEDHDGTKYMITCIDLENGNFKANCSLIGGETYETFETEAFPSKQAALDRAREWARNKIDGRAS